MSPPFQSSIDHEVKWVQQIPAASTLKREREREGGREGENNLPSGSLTQRLA
jgi:hypothetical protein